MAEEVKDPWDSWAQRLIDHQELQNVPTRRGHVRSNVITVDAEQGESRLSLSEEKEARSKILLSIFSVPRPSKPEATLSVPVAPFNSTENPLQEPPLPWAHLELRGSLVHALNFPKWEWFPSLQRLQFCDFYIFSPEVRQKWFLYLAQLAFEGKSLPAIHLRAAPGFSARASDYLPLFYGLASRVLQIRDYDGEALDVDTTNTNVLRQVRLSGLQKIWLDSAVASDLFVLLAGSVYYEHGLGSLADLVLTIHGWRCSSLDTAQQGFSRLMTEAYVTFFKRLMSRVYVLRAPMPLMTWRCPVDQPALLKRCFAAWVSALFPADLASCKPRAKKPYVHRLILTPRSTLPWEVRRDWDAFWTHEFMALVKQLGVKEWQLWRRSRPELSAESYAITYGPLHLVDFFVAYQEHFTLVTTGLVPRQVFPNQAPFVREQYEAVTLT